MLITSLDRVYSYIGDVNGNLTRTTFNNRLLLDWITSISSRVERYLNRKIEIKSRTEYFEVSYNRIKYYPIATPIQSVSSVYVDSTGIFDGSESEYTGDDYYLDTHSQSIVLSSPEKYRAARGLKIVYTGGLAEYAVKSTFAISSKSGTFTNGYYVVGSNSNAVGKLVSSTENSVVINNLYGIFEVGDTITVQELEDSADIGSPTANIESITIQSLAESHPDIVRAAEIEIRYMWAHKMDLENIGTNADGTTLRRSSGKYILQPETRAYLDPYKKYLYS